MIIGRQELTDAALRIRPYLPPTPVVRSASLSDRLGVEVVLKLELLQPTHSFKVRGAFNALLALSPEQRGRGVLAASQGNHGLGVAFAAAHLGLTATIYLPRDAASERVAALRALGAEVVLHGDSWDEANLEATAVARATGRAYLHPFDDPAVMAGQGTILLELLEQAPALDRLVASIGGGGLLSGLASAAHHFSPQTRLAGVETLGADCLYQSRRAGRLVELPAITSVAKSLGARRSEPRPFGIIEQLVSNLAVVSDQQAIEALVGLLADEKLLVEPAASCTVAALTAGQIPLRPGETVVVILCGGNITPREVFALARELGLAA